MVMKENIQNNELCIEHIGTNLTLAVSLTTELISKKFHELAHIDIISI